MAFQLHYLVQHAADVDRSSLADPVQHKMPGSCDDCPARASTLLAITEVIAPHVIAQFRSRNATGTEWVGGYIGKCRKQQCLVAYPCRVTEAVRRP